MNRILPLFQGLVSFGGGGIATLTAGQQNTDSYNTLTVFSSIVWDGMFLNLS